MKKSIVLFLMLALSSSIAHAGAFEWITGKAAETEPVVIVNEPVKCVFLNSNSEQKCHTDDGKFSCSGTGTCIAEVSGEQGTKLAW